MSEHPLDPLSAAEFSAVTAILRRDRDVTTTPGSWRITGIEMAEPTKAELAAFEAGGPRPARRRALTRSTVTGWWMLRRP